MKQFNNEGAITVFLSLLIVSMLCVVCSTVEVARVNLVKPQVERALNTAMNSVLAEYDKDLMHKYGLAALDSTYGTNTQSKAKIEEKLQYYLEHTLQPDKELDNGNLIYQLLEKKSDDFVDLYKFKVNNVEINSYTGLIEEKAAIAKHQIIDYMKYRGPLLGVEAYLEQLKKVIKAVKANEIIQKKTSVDEATVDVEDKYLELMTLIDGIQFDSDGNTKMQNGKIKLASMYAKKITFTKSSNAKDTYINNSVLSNAVKDNRYQANMNDITNYLKNAYECKKECFRLEKSISELEDSISELEDQLNIMNIVNENIDKSENSEEEDLSVLETAKELMKLREEQSELEEELTNKNSEYENNKNNYINKVNEYKSILLKNRQLHKDALNKIDEIESKLDTVKIEINKYESELENNKNDIDSKVYKNLNEDLTKVKTQFGIVKGTKSTAMTSLSDVKNGLNINLNIIKKEKIDELEDYINNEFINKLEQKAKEDATGEINSTGSFSISNVCQELTNIEKPFLDFSTSKFRFDYSSLKLDENAMSNETKTDPRKFKKLSDSLSLFNFIKPKELPNNNKTIEGSNLPSTYYKEGKSEDFNNNTMEGDIKDTSFFTGIFDDLSNIGKKLKDSVKYLYSEVLVNEYIMRDFRTAVDHLKDADTRTLSNDDMNEHFLDYEVEYILAGNLKDDKNLESVSTKIVLIRYALNLLHILTDNTKRTQSFELASALIGFTPLAFLVYVLQFIIMSIWSLAESYADLKDLLSGKSVPFFKRASEWKLSLENFKMLKDGVTEVIDNINTESSTRAPETNTDTGVNLKKSGDKEEIDLEEEKEKKEDDQDFKFNLNLSYEDYLRILLLFFVNDTEKIYRTLDCIQLNEQQHRGDDLKLENFLFEYNADVEVEIPYLFFNLPFMPKQIKDFASNNQHKIKVRLSQSY